MRRSFVEEEKAPARLTPVPQGASESVAGQLPEQEAGQSNKKSAPLHREKGSPLKGKLLKAGIITFASLGVISLLMPVLTGVSVGEATKYFNLRDSFNWDNLVHLRGTSALKLGQFGAATNTLLTLPPDGSEARELMDELFPRLLEAREYGRATQALQHFKPESGSFAGLNAVDYQRQAENFEKVGAHMGANLGLEKSMALLAQDPHLTAARMALIRPMFIAVAARELPALEKLAPTLSPTERQVATEAILYTHKQAKNWEAAWQHTRTLPTDLRRISQGDVLTTLARENPTQALERLAALKGSPEYLRHFTSVFQGLGSNHPQRAVALLEQLESVQLREQAIGMLITRQGMRAGKYLSLKEITALIDRLTDPVIKAKALVFLTLPFELHPTRERKEFSSKHIVPRLAELWRQNPTLAPLHDAYLIIYESGVSNEAQIMDPALRASVKRAMGTDAIYDINRAQRRILDKLRANRFSLIETKK